MNTFSSLSPAARTGVCWRCNAHTNIDKYKYCYYYVQRGNRWLMWAPEGWLDPLSVDITYRKGEMIMTSPTYGRMYQISRLEFLLGTGVDPDAECGVNPFRSV